MSSYNFYTVAEINLDSLIHNFQVIKQKVAPAEVMAVVKANAYGHGAVEVTKALASVGAKFFAVARVSEEEELRNAGIDDKILIFGALFPDEMEAAIANGCRITLTSFSDLENALKISKRLNKKVIVHIKVDTGMGRVGIIWNEARKLIELASKCSEIIIEGVYTHFATSDSSDKSFAYVQLERFQSIKAETQLMGLKIPYFHAANSGAILDLPQTYFDMVRPGISLYGHYPSLETSESIPLKQVMTLKSKVVALRRLPAGTSISYGRRYFTSNDTTIAVLPIGYADGIFRAFSNVGKVMIRGKMYPIVGTVTMDTIMVDVGNDRVEVGDDVYFWGETPFGSVSATKLASEIGTIAYELCCAVSKRVPRVYIKD